MKTKKFFVKACCTLAACGLMSSCIKDSNNEIIYTQSFLSFFNVIYTEGVAEPTYQNNISYNNESNYTNMTANITIQGLTLPGTSYSTVKLIDLPWKVTADGWKMLTSNEVKATSESVAPDFDNFTFNIYDRNVKVYIQGNLVETYYPLMYVAYQLNNYKYKIVSLPCAVINEGTTYVTNQNSETYEQTESRYYIELSSSTSVDLNDESKRVAKMIIYDAKFDANMPAMNMVFNNIPYNVDSRGRVMLECDALTPELLSATSTTTPMPNFPITKISGFTDACNNMHLTFICTMAQSGTAYNVTVECQQPS